MNWQRKRMAPLRVLDLFSGIGGFSLGLERTGGFRTVAFCEIDPDCRAVIRSHWHTICIFDDVRPLHASNLGRIDFICAGFPCQDVSVSNPSATGSEGNRTGLYKEAIRLAGELGCALLMENVPGLLNFGFGNLLRELAKIGFDAEWECISARDVGADHQRERLWILAYPNGERQQRPEFIRTGVLRIAKEALSEYCDEAFGEWRALVAAKQLLRGSDGLSLAVERRRISALGNAVVPQIPQAIGQAILETIAAQP